MSSVGIFGVQFNGWYEDLLPGWFEACLAAQPNQIVLASDVKRPVPSGVDLVVVKPGKYRWPIPEFSNAAVAALGTDWCWNMDVDDRIFRLALREICVVDAEVYQAGIVLPDKVQYCPRVLSWKQVLDSPHCLLNAGSAFKKWLWEKVGGYPDIGFHDWGLWRLMAREKARFAAAQEVSYFHNSHKGSASSLVDQKVALAEVMAL